MMEIEKTTVCARTQYFASISGDSIYRSYSKINLKQKNESQNSINFVLKLISLWWALVAQSDGYRWHFHCSNPTTAHWKMENFRLAICHGLDRLCRLVH